MQISNSGGQYPFWSKHGSQLFFETPDGRIKVVDYIADADSFQPGKPAFWYDKPLFYAGASNMDLAPDGRRFVVLTTPETANGEKRSVHVTILEDFFAELRRRVIGSEK